VTEPSTPPPMPPRAGLRGLVEAHRTGALDRPTGPANPYETWVFAASVLAGVLALTPYATPTSLDEATWPGFQIMWGTVHAVAGAVALAGLYWPGQPIRAIYVKRAGILGLAGTFSTYGIALLTVTGPSGVVVGLELLSLGVACLVRAVQITRIAGRVMARSRALDAGDTARDEAARRDGAT
jgi:hypothetical protein